MQNSYTSSQAGTATMNGTPTVNDYSLTNNQMLPNNNRHTPQMATAYLIKRPQQTTNENGSYNQNDLLANQTMNSATYSPSPVSFTGTPFTGSNSRSADPISSAPTSFKPLEFAQLQQNQSSMGTPSPTPMYASMNYQSNPLFPSTATTSSENRGQNPSNNAQSTMQSFPFHSQITTAPHQPTVLMPAPPPAPQLHPSSSVNSNNGSTTMQRSFSAVSTNQQQSSAAPVPPPPHLLHSSYSASTFNNHPTNQPPVQQTMSPFPSPAQYRPMQPPALAPGPPSGFATPPLSTSSSATWSQAPALRPMPPGRVLSYDSGNAMNQQQHQQPSIAAVQPQQSSFPPSRAPPHVMAATPQQSATNFPHPPTSSSSTTFNAAAAVNNLIPSMQQMNLTSHQHPPSGPPSHPGLPPHSFSSFPPQPPIAAAAGGGGGPPVVDIPDHCRVVNLLQQTTSLSGDSILSGYMENPLDFDLPAPLLSKQPRKNNCDPSIMSCTLNVIPSTTNLLQESRLPLGVVLHPFRDLARLPVIQSSVIVRCRQCRTYIHPFVGLAEQGGRRWKCTVCFRVNDLPDEFQYDPVSKKYGEPQLRPEIKSATVEFIAPAEYTLRPPQPAVYLFLMEVSKIAISSGYLNIVCREISNYLDDMPGDDRMSIGFMTYGDSIDYFKLNCGQPRLCSCPDLEEVFLPEPDGLIVKRDSYACNIHDLLENLPSLYENSRQEGNCLGSALQAAFKLIEGVGGRITVFNHTLPNLGQGVLKNRTQLVNTQEKREALLITATDFYKSFALECASKQVAVDLFSLGPIYQDLPTLSGMCRFSGGGLYRYTNVSFTGANNSTITTSSTAAKLSSLSATSIGTSITDLDRYRLRHDFIRYLTRKIGFEAVMRLRCTRGLNILAFHGNCFVRSIDLVSLPNVSPDAGFAIHLGMENSLQNLSNVCLQTALLYTSSQGERRIRVHTLCIPISSQMSEIYQHANHFAILGLVSRMAVDRILNTGGSSAIVSAREALIHAILDPLYVFAKYEHRSASTSQLCTPYYLRHLPRLIFALLKSDAVLPPGHVHMSSVDDQLFSLECLRNYPLTRLIPYLYPSLFALQEMPTSLPSSTLKPTSSLDSLNNQFSDKPCDNSSANNSRTSTPSESSEGSITSSSCSMPSTNTVDAVRSSSSAKSHQNTMIDKLDTRIDKLLLRGQIGIRRLPLSLGHVMRDGAYLLDCGDFHLLLLCRELPSIFMQQLFSSSLSTSSSSLTSSSATLTSSDVNATLTPTAEGHVKKENEEDNDNNNESNSELILRQLSNNGICIGYGNSIIPKLQEPINLCLRSLLRCLQTQRRLGSVTAVLRDNSSLRSSLIFRRMLEDRSLSSDGSSNNHQLNNHSVSAIQAAVSCLSYVDFLQILSLAVQNRK